MISPAAWRRPIPPAYSTRTTMRRRPGPICAIARRAPPITGNLNIAGINYNRPVRQLFPTMSIRHRADPSGPGGDLEIQRADGREFRLGVRRQRLQLHHRQSARCHHCAVPAAAGGGAEAHQPFLNGTGWYTLDAKECVDGLDRSSDLVQVMHRDARNALPSSNTMSPTGSVARADIDLATAAKGRAATNAFWVQDVWSFAPGFKATLGGRVEDWRAYDGINFSAAPVLNVSQPKLATSTFSPKASLAWQVSDPWLLTASYGQAYRMPTVTELYQAVTTGTLRSRVPNSNLNFPNMPAPLNWRPSGRPGMDAFASRCSRKTSPTRCCRNPRPWCQVRTPCSALCRMWIAPACAASSWSRSRTM